VVVIPKTQVDHPKAGTAVISRQRRIELLREVGPAQLFRYTAANPRISMAFMEALDLVTMKKGFIV